MDKARVAKIISAKRIAALSAQFARFNHMSLFPASRLKQSEKKFGSNDDTSAGTNPRSV